MRPEVEFGKMVGAASQLPVEVSESWLPSLALFAGAVISVPVMAHIFPGPLAPGSSSMMIVQGIGAVAVVGLMSYLTTIDADPFPYGMLYGGALMVLCVEVWYREDPTLFNGTLFGRWVFFLRGWPFFLFHQPYEQDTKAPIPLSGYTRVFGSWHAGGVCLCFFMHVLGMSFPQEQKAQTALALGLLWVVWGAINSWRSVYGAAQFCQSGIQIHSLTGPGCGLAGYWMLSWWSRHRGPVPFADFTSSETIVLGTFGIYAVFTMLWLLTQERVEAVADKAD